MGSWLPQLRSLVFAVYGEVSRFVVESTFVRSKKLWETWIMSEPVALKGLPETSGNYAWGVM